MEAFWKSSFVVPAGAVELFLDSVDADALSIAAFEIDGSENGDGTLWCVEMLHREEPDREDLEVLLEPLCERASLGPLAIDIDPVPKEDWVKHVQASMPPRQIGRFWIHGSHVDTPPPAGLTPIRLDAGLAFGSGEHASTQGCLQALDRLARRRRFRRVLDMGSGAGMLAIAAAKCWPARILAVDNDPVAVEVAAENIRQNGVGRLVQALVSEGYADPEIRRRGPYDLILANILADPLCNMARDLARSLDVDGIAVLSGLLDRQADRVQAAHHGYGLYLRQRINIGPWTTLIMSRKKA
ncbi:MAG: 50S ribosomal protein L11 methyltransferase [Alphaproteobacteria bacterium]|nr:50S ribosomal protein L11 methyltransferase [Alphaproteobacteria bacterium]